MGLFDFFKKKPTEETPVEEQREGVVEIDGVEVETDVETEEISAEELEAESEIEIEFVDEDGEELLTAENEDEAEAVLEELTDMAGEILAEKPLAEDEVIVSQEDGEVFTADNDEDALAFLDALADEFAEELDEELHHEEVEEEKEEPAAEEVKEETPAAEEEKPAKVGFFAKLKAGLDKTRKNILGGVDGVLGAFTKIDEDLFEELEEALIMADLGVQTTMDIVENLRKRVKREHATDPSVIKDMLIDEITAILEEGAEEA